MSAKGTKIRSVRPHLRLLPRSSPSYELLVAAFKDENFDWREISSLTSSRDARGLDALDSGNSFS